MTKIPAVLLVLSALCTPLSAELVEVVSTLSTYGSIAREIGGDRVRVQSIARGDEDAHFVKPKPSFALMLKRADLLVTTGLDLELWEPVVVDKSGNRAIRDGQSGYVRASEGVPLLDVPANASREAGDVHIYGNPHVHTSPIAAGTIAANIAAGLSRVDPEGAKIYSRNLDRFQQRLDIALFGAELVEILDGDLLRSLTEQGRLVSFLESQDLDGSALIDRLGGWLGKGLSFRGRKIIAYHKNWIYFTSLFGLDVVNFVEPKPGIPPSARHVKKLIDQIEEQRIEVLIAASYFDPKKPATIADRTGCQAVILPLGTGVSGVDDYFSLLDLWVDSLSEAFSTTGGEQ